MKGKSCFFSDKLDEMLAVRHELNKIAQRYNAGKKIGLPEKGIGTGLAELYRRSPVIFKYITLFFLRLDKNYTKKHD